MTQSNQVVACGQGPFTHDKNRSTPEHVLKNKCLFRLKSPEIFSENFLWKWGGDQITRRGFINGTAKEKNNFLSSKRFIASNLFHVFQGDEIRKLFVG